MVVSDSEHMNRMSREDWSGNVHISRKMSWGNPSAEKQCFHRKPLGPTKGSMHRVSPQELPTISWTLDWLERVRGRLKVQSMVPCDAFHNYAFVLWSHLHYSLQYVFISLWRHEKRRDSFKTELKSIVRKLFTVQMFILRFTLETIKKQ